MKTSNNIKKLLNMVFRSQKNQQPSNKDTQTFSTDLKQNEKMIKEKLGTSDDIMLTRFTIKTEDDKNINALLVAVDGLVDEDLKRENILKPLQLKPLNERPNSNLDQIQDMIQVKNIEVKNQVDYALNKVMQASIFLLIDGNENGLLIKAEGFENRAIDEPSNEITVRGADEGFIENNALNVTMIRRRVANQNLRFESFEIGDVTKTDIKIGYIKGIAHPTIIKRVREKVKKNRY